MPSNPPSRPMPDCLVAEALFVTMKTVQYHLGNVYRKLEIGSREGLAEVFPPDEP